MSKETIHAHMCMHADRQGACHFTNRWSPATDDCR